MRVNQSIHTGSGGMGILLNRRKIFRLISFQLILFGITLSRNEACATKILLKTRPNTYFHLPIEFSFPVVKNGPGFLKFLNGYLVGVANNSSGIYNFELLEDNSVVDVELVVQRESGLCYDPVLQIFSKSLTLDEKLNIAKQTETGIHINGKNRGLEFIDGPELEEQYDSASAPIITKLRYQIPCQDYYANLNYQSDNDIQSSMVDADILSREKRQDKDKHSHHDNLESSGDGDIDENDDYDEDDEEDEDIEERVVPSVPTPTFELSSMTLIPSSSDIDKYFEPILSTSADIDENLIVPTPTTSSFATRSVSLQPIQASPSLHPHHDLLSSSALMFENLSDAGSGDFDIPSSTGHHSTTRPTPAPPHFPDHDHDHDVEIFKPTTAPNNEEKPNAPILKKRIEKILIPAGKTLRFDIPKDTFVSENNIIFHLESENGTVISRSVDSTMWITFIGDTTIVFAPTIDQVSEYTYYLIAVDEKTYTRASSELLISVRQRSKTRMYNHEFELTFTKLAAGEISDFIAKIVNYSRGNSKGNTDDDLILTKMEMDGNIFKIKWTNESLYEGYNLNSCPKDDLTGIYKRLANTEGEPTSEFKTYVQPNYTPTDLKINLLFSSHCDSVKPADITQSINTVQRPTARKENFQPSIKNPVDKLDATEGEYLIRKVREDFCYDPEDGNTKSLDLKLMFSNSVEVNESNWLQFDSKNQEFYGLPMSGSDKPRTESYVLGCTDSGGRSANDALEVTITPQPKISYSAEFSLHFQSVPFTPQNLRKFLTKLSTIFIDDITNIVVKNYQESVNLNISQVHFRWFNKSDPNTEFEVTELGRVLFSEAGPPNKRVVDYFKPEFNLSGGQVIPKGKLIGSGTHHFDIGGKSVENGGVQGGDDDVTKLNTAIDSETSDGAYLVTYIIPSVLIFVMILLASFIACLLSRKRKAIPTSSEEETKGFMKKGVPIILQEEYDDAPYNSGRGGVADLGTGSRSRSPAILREERPPLPPSYSRRSPPNIDYRNSAANQPSYQPPPPPAARVILPSRGMRPGGSSAAANYRKPPPYVPP